MFSKRDVCLWVVSILFIVLSFMIFDRCNYLILLASVIGVTSLIFNARGNPIGQLLMIIFSVLYGIISYGFDYYGEMITYLLMTAPMALFALISWLKNPYEGSKEVKVNTLTSKEIILMIVLAIIVTMIFYQILVYYHTANIVFSTISITSSFIAVYLTFRRSAYFALAYASNDVVLIILWILASMLDRSYISVVVCFVVFLVNDIYGFISWQKMKVRQMKK